MECKNCGHEGYDFWALRVPLLWRFPLIGNIFKGIKIGSCCDKPEPKKVSNAT